MKNIVILPIFIPQDPNLHKFGGWEWMEYSKQAWQYWCDKHGYQLVIYDSPRIEDTTSFKITVQRWFDIFDFLKEKNIEFDQALMTDTTSIPRWDCPDFFKLTKNRLTVRREIDNLNWVYEGIQGYKDIFGGYDLDITKYFNSGFVIFNKSHESLFNKFKEKYTSQSEEFLNLQKTVKRGTCQTPLNYITQINNINVNYISPSFNVSHLPRKELLSHNWQLKESKTPHFIKYGYIWVFSGVDKTQRNNLMKQVWDIVKHNYTKSPIENILDSINHKDTYKNATSRKFKEDLYDYFKESPLKTVVEFGCCKGDTTKILSLISENVYASDLDSANIEDAKNKCISSYNISFEIKDVNTEWNYSNPDLIYLDALHDYNGILQGLNRIKTQYPDTIIVMDDYGHIMNTVKPIIDNLIKEDKINVLKWVGEDKGYVATNGKEFIDKEGLIFKFKN